MRKNVNSVRLEGKLYQSELELKTVKDTTSANFGKEFIQGVIHIATDENAMNVVPVHYTYVTATTKAGKPNTTYTMLKKIIDDPNCAWIKGGAENALPLIVDSAIGLNEFYTEDNGTLTLVSAKRVEGGFLSQATKFNEDPEKRNSFRVDMFIQNVNMVEENEEKKIPAFLEVKGAIFNFRNDLLPISFKVTSKEGIDYFNSLDLGPANPMYVQVWGSIECSTIKEIKETKAAFGKNAVQETTRTFRDWIITSMADEAYDYGNEEVLTADDITKALQAREVMLAEKKAQREKYLAEKNSAPAATGFPVPTAAPAPAVNPGGFTF